MCWHFSLRLMISSVGIEVAQTWIEHYNRKFAILRLNEVLAWPVSWVNFIQCMFCADSSERHLWRFRSGLWRRRPVPPWRHGRQLQPERLHLQTSHRYSTVFLDEHITWSYGVRSITVTCKPNFHYNEVFLRSRGLLFTFSFNWK